MKTNTTPRPVYLGEKLTGKLAGTKLSSILPPHHDLCFVPFNWSAQ